jgi:hypothetical protein
MRSQTLIRAGIIGITTATILLGYYLAHVGLPTPYMRTSPDMGGEPVESRGFTVSTYPQASLAIAASVIVLIGELVNRPVVSVAGGLALLSFSLIYVFSVGTWFWPTLAILLPLLAFRAVSRPSEKSPNKLPGGR